VESSGSDPAQLCRAAAAEILRMQPYANSESMSFSIRTRIRLTFKPIQLCFGDPILVQGAPNFQEVIAF
jgi:hypothetical protein